MTSEHPTSITVVDLARRLKEPEPPFLLDVREPDEFEYCNVGGTLIPLGELSQRLDEVPADREIVVLCHHGVRSGHAAAFLRANGFAVVKNITGGIDRWSSEVDPAVKKY